MRSFALFCALKLCALLRTCACARLRSSDPPTLAFFPEKKGRELWKKNKGLSLRGTPKTLGKGRENVQKKQGKSEKKNKESEKNKDWRVRVVVLYWVPHVEPIPKNPH